MVGRFKAVQAEHGPDSVAFISTGQIASEEMALLGAVAKFGMGMVHGDGNTRQCMATAVVAYKESFGFDAPPYTYADLEESDVIVLWGANPCIAHPILWERICRNPHHPEVIVVDPRVTETAAAATQHYPLLPKSDLTLAYGIAHLLIAWGAVDKDFVEASTEGFEGFVAHVEAFTPERVSAATGLPVDALELMADTIASGKRVSFWWTMGVNQSHEGTRLAQAIIDLALLTGNIGRPGTGANSITGQCNAMGSRLWSNTTNLLGGRAFTDAAHRAEVSELLNVDVSVIPDRPSWAYDQIVDGIREGTIKALWVVATNTAHSWIHQSEVRDLLGRLDTLVVQDLYPTTETAQLADIVLPAAGWGEKEGTFVNSERRYGRIRRVVRAPGQALADFAIFKLVADAWGCGDMFEEWSSPEAVFAHPPAPLRRPPLRYHGNRAATRSSKPPGGIQWPVPPAPLTRNAGCTRTGGSSTLTGRPGSCGRSPARSPSPPPRSSPSSSSPGGGAPASGTPRPAPRSRPSSGRCTPRSPTSRSRRPMPPPSAWRPTSGCSSPLHGARWRPAPTSRPPWPRARSSSPCTTPPPTASPGRASIRTPASPPTSRPRWVSDALAGSPRYS